MRYHWETRARDGARSSERQIAKGAGTGYVVSRCIEKAKDDLLHRGDALPITELFHWSSIVIVIENVAENVAETGEEV